TTTSSSSSPLPPLTWPRGNGQGGRTPPTVPVEARLVRGPGARATPASAPTADALAADLGADLVLDDDQPPAAPEPNAQAGPKHEAQGAGANGTTAGHEAEAKKAEETEKEKKETGGAEARGKADRPREPDKQPGAREADARAKSAKKGKGRKTDAGREGK